MKNDKLLVADQPFLVRTQNCLERAEIKTLGALRNKYPQQLLAYKGLGRKTLLDIKEILSDHGMLLKEHNNG